MKVSELVITCPVSGNFTGSAMPRLSFTCCICPSQGAIIPYFDHEICLISLADFC